jgi:hypothetical protein
MIGLVEFAGRGYGYGHMNAFPVQFVLQSVEKTTVKDLAPNYNPSEFSTKPVRFPTGYLTGTLVGPDGWPVANADLFIYWAADPSKHVENDSATTDRKGHFKFAVDPGKYIIGFNTFWPPSAEAPYPPTYYPSTQRQSDAKVVAVADKQHVGNLVIKLPPPIPVRTIPVKVVWPDGRPVADANVWLSQLNDPVTTVGTAVSHTALDGSFDLLGLQGIDYILHADKYAGLGHVSCAKTILVRADQTVTAPIQLSLARNDYNTCAALDLEVPTGKAPQE